MSGLKITATIILLLALFTVGCGGGGGGGGGTTGTVVISAADSVGALIPSAPVEVYKVISTGSILVASGTTSAVPPYTLILTIQAGDYQAYYVPAGGSGNKYPYPEVGIMTVTANASIPFPIQMPLAPPSPPAE